MKKINLIVIIFLFSANLICQNEKGLFSISVGQGMPFGKFAHTDIGEGGAGFAKTGLTYKASIAYLLSEKFGVTATFQNQQNQININSLSRQMSANSGIAWNVSSKPWNTNLYLVGMIYYMPLVKNAKGDPFLFLDLKAMLGSAFVTLPQQTFSTYQNNILFTETSNTDLDVDPAISISAKLRCKIFKGIYAHIAADYFTTKTQYRNVMQTFSDGTSQTVEVNQKINVISFTAGLDFLF